MTVTPTPRYTTARDLTHGSTRHALAFATAFLDAGCGSREGQFERRPIA